MKEKFKEYYKPSEEEFKSLWENCIFALDANILLGLYRFSKDTGQKFLDIIKSDPSRFWIPYQAAKEFHLGRVKVISKQSKRFEDVKQFLRNEIDSVGKGLEEFNHPYIKIDKIMNKFNLQLMNISKDLDKQKSQYPDPAENDYIKEFLEKYFEDRVGDELSNNELLKIVRDGEIRYNLNIPPGYKDSTKEGIKKFGDLIIWKELIKLTKKTNKPLIFITDEEKEDWWWKDANGDPVLPRPELIREMLKETGCRFYMYRLKGFIERSKDYLNQKDIGGAIKEIDEAEKRKHAMDKLFEMLENIKAKDEMLRKSIQPPQTVADILSRLANTGKPNMTEAEKQSGIEFLNKLNREYMDSDAYRSNKLMNLLLNNPDISDYRTSSNNIVNEAEKKQDKDSDK